VKLGDDVSTGIAFANVRVRREEILGAFPDVVPKSSVVLVAVFRTEANQKKRPLTQGEAVKIARDNMIRAKKFVRSLMRYRAESNRDRKGLEINPPLCRGQAAPPGGSLPTPRPRLRLSSASLSYKF